VVKDVSSILVSHDLDEAGMFLPKWVDTESDFEGFVGYAYPGDALASVRDEIVELYPPKAFDNNQTRRVAAVLRDSTFVCTNYQIYHAYKSKVYAARYEMPPASHGFDLFPIIWNTGADISDMLKVLAPWVPEFISNMFEGIWIYLARTYQLYFAGHALSGDPNYLTRRGSER
jgi:hypothetical protein